MQDFRCAPQVPKTLHTYTVQPSYLLHRGASIRPNPQMGSQSMKAEHTGGFGGSQQGGDRVLVPNSSTASPHCLVH